MRARTTGEVVVGLAVLSIVAWQLWPRESAPEPAPGGWSIADLLGEGGEDDDQGGFARAVEGRAFAFPADHGPHPSFRNEWWYFVGNLHDAGGRRFGFQLTFFRAGLAPPDERAPARGSRWATDQVYMAHFAITDVAAGRHVAFERFARGALGLGGAAAEPFRVSVGDWSAGAASDQTFLPLELRAREDGVALELRLDAGKPVVAQGDRGLSQKGAAPGNASLYYSLTRLPARGAIEIGGERFAVEGLAWLDREWSTSALGADQVGWDWLALQLDDGSEVMFYRLRRQDGSADPHSAGSLVAADGTTRALGRDDVAIETLGDWTSEDGVRYPGGLWLRVPSAELELRVEPLVADQELRLGVRYWEGAVRARGTRVGRAIAGHGYLELTGYARGGGSRGR